METEIHWDCKHVNMWTLSMLGNAGTTISKHFSQWDVFLMKSRPERKHSPRRRSGTLWGQKVSGSSMWTLPELQLHSQNATSAHFSADCLKKKIVLLVWTSSFCQQQQSEASLFINTVHVQTSADSQGNVCHQAAGVNMTQRPAGGSTSETLNTVYCPSDHIH